MGFTSGELRDFVDAVRGSETSTDCVVVGTVSRVDPDGTAWVQIGQNAEPTPCARDMACHAGDEVTVRIADHKATVTGNASAPATDDRKANVAHGVASAAQHTADTAQATAQEADGRAQTAQRTAMTAKDTADAASTAAGEAKALAEMTDQHFWTDTRGAHVTESKREDYEQAPTGFQQLMTSAGQLLTRAVEGVERLLRSDTASGTVFYDGECAPGAQDAEDHVVAAFTKDGAQIGRKGNAHVEMDFNTFRLTDKDSVDFFVADDLRGSDGLAVLVETFSGNGTTTEFLVTFEPDSYVSVTDNSHEGAAYTTYGRTVHFSVAPSDGATVTVTYKTASTSAKVYTLGKRRVGSVAGPMSVAEGDGATASGYASHAEGVYTTASGESSHAEGGGTASGESSHAEGGGTASGYASHAEGSGTIASDYNSHAEGDGTTASGYASHAEGRDTTASGDRSHAEGEGTIASSDRQHVEGKYNVADANGTYAHIVGNGTSDSNRSNAHTVDWSGNAWYAGNVSADGALSCADGNPYCSDGTNVKVGGTTVGSADNLSYVSSTNTLRAPTTTTLHVASSATAVYENVSKYIVFGKLVLVMFHFGLRGAQAQTNFYRLFDQLPAGKSETWALLGNSTGTLPVTIKPAGYVQVDGMPPNRQAYYVGFGIYELA